VTVEALAAAVNAARRTPVHVVKRLDEVATAVADLARPGDLVLTLGAGSIGGLAAALVAELERRATDVTQIKTATDGTQTKTATDGTQIKTDGGRH
jgi:hypothetical protein